VKAAVFRFRYEILTAIAIILIATVVVLILVTPHEIYRAYGEITSIDESGIRIEIQRISFNVPASGDVPMVVDTNAGICFLDPQFGFAHCKLGTKVELILYENEFRSFWYINSVMKDIDDYGKEKEEA